jgi:hypothetical protein
VPGLGETAWVDRHLGLTWARVRSAVPNEDWMPVVMQDDKGMATTNVVEYGCGHYGCVMPTYDDKVVMKLTSDETEAFFVAAALSMDDPNAWNGVVEYFGIFRLKSAFHRKRPLYILWREAANSVGIVELEQFVAGADEYKQRQLRELSRYLEQFKDSAKAVRSSLKRSKDPYALVEESKKWEQWAWDQVSSDYGDNKWVFEGTRGAQRVAAHLRACQQIAELMEHTYMSDAVGEALGFFLENGLLLADVHHHNIGTVYREDYDGDRIVITDPGHAVPLIDRWDEVVIEEI